MAKRGKKAKEDMTEELGDGETVDLYARLGITSSASDEEIRKAYEK